MAVDRKTIIDKVFQGHAVEGEGYIPPRFADYFWKPSDGQKLAYDPAKAAALLDEAGLQEEQRGQARRQGRQAARLPYPLPRHRPERQGDRQVPPGVVGRAGHRR